MRATITISVSEKEAAEIRQNAVKFDSVSDYLRALARWHARRLLAYPPPLRANEHMAGRPQLPPAWRCNSHVNFTTGPKTSVSLTDAAILGEWRST